jgi:predicted TIM-barrel fold metal-dependent hydrolase
MMVSTKLKEPVSDRPTDGVAETLLIDTDVHESIKSTRELVPYLDSHWQRYITEYGWNHLSFPAALPYVVPVASNNAFRKDWILEDGTGATSVEALRRHLFDGEGVSIAILNGFFYPSSISGNYELAAALASAYNDWQIEHWLDKDSRLRGSIQIAVDDPQVAVREIERVADHPQIVQVFLSLSTERQWGDPRYLPIFEAASRHDLAVAFHHSQATRTLLGYPRHYIEWHTLAAPQAAMNQITSLIFNGVFDKFPQLTTVFLECGVAWLPWLMWRADQQYREVRVDVPWVKRLPSEYMRDNIRISTQPMSDVKPQHFAKLVEWTESERMFMFSTDYPHYDADSVDHVLPRTLPEGLRRRIRYQNAIESYPRLRGLGHEARSVSAG